MKRIIVIGGLSAGPSAAAKARRENEQAEIILFEKGANISYATCGMPYVFSGVIESRDNLLVVKPALLKTRFNIDVRLNEEIIRINTKEKIVYTETDGYRYDTLVFATGASSVVPPIDNVKLAHGWSTCRSMVDFDKITNEALTSDSKHITVVGGGLIGVEVAENLKEAGKNVTLIEGAPFILNMWEKKFAKFGEAVLISKGVEVLSNTFVSKFDIDKDGKILAVITSDGKRIPTDFVVLSAGIKPNTQLLLDEGAEAIGNCALKVNEFMETSIKDVFAAGDNISIKNVQTNEDDYFPLGTHSNKAGRAAGSNATSGNIAFKGGYKTAIVKVFDYTLARTGMNATALNKNGIDFKSVLVVAGSTPSYYPNPKDLIIELYYNPKTDKILGAELFGEYGVDKRVDVLSTAIYAKLKVSDLPLLDLAYAPPFSPAKDPVVVAGYVVENILNNKTDQISVEDLERFMDNTPKDEYLLLDVRNENEYEKGTIPGAINYPLDTLRQNIDSVLVQEKKVIVFCQKGLRGYLAESILRHNGVTDIFNIGGGYKVWEMYSDKIEVPNKHIPHASV
ncbi:FAD-dependent oxidoreductase [uncultured Formosa sp.]|uniref:FAD-dependent oxidoreductase n=1 Tax=uncultured Formosa sp. TaxID=255435 RepID=UPI00262B818C|nr:FAD-dependent oxidoreductase [uncultured Formosa sp.]